MATLNEALPIYLSVGASNYPKKSFDRLVAVFGEAEANRLVAALEGLLFELDATQVDWNGHTLASGTEWAVSQFRQRHPELDDGACRALDWYFSFNWR